MLDYFNLAPFQLTPNSFRTTVALYILYGEASLGKPLDKEFVYYYCLKSLSKTTSFYYLSKWSSRDVWDLGKVG